MVRRGSTVRVRQRALHWQESFVTRLAATGPLVSFVRVTVDARQARSLVRLRVTPSVSGLRPVDEALLRRGGAVLLVYGDGGQFDGSSVAFAARHSSRRTVYAAWLDSSGSAAVRTVTAATYAAAQQSAVGLVLAGAPLGGRSTISVPVRAPAAQLQPIRHLPSLLSLNRSGSAVRRARKLRRRVSSSQHRVE